RITHERLSKATLQLSHGFATNRPPAKPTSGLLDNRLDIRFREATVVESARTEGTGVQEVVLDLVYRQNERAKRPAGIIPRRFVCRTEVSIRQAKHTGKARFFGVLDNRSNTFVAAAHQEQDAGIVPESREVFTRQRVFDPQIDRASIQTGSRHVPRHARSSSCPNRFDRTPNLGTRIVLRHQEVALVRPRFVVDLRRMRCDHELGTRLVPHQASHNRSMPLRVQVQFGLVDENDAFPILVQREGAQKEEQLQLARTEQVNLEEEALGCPKVYVERTTSRLFGLDDFDREGLVSPGIELSPRLVDHRHDLRITSDVGEPVVESLNRCDVHEELLDVQKPVLIISCRATTSLTHGCVYRADKGGHSPGRKIPNRQLFIHPKWLGHRACNDDFAFLAVNLELGSNLVAVRSVTNSPATSPACDQFGTIVATGCKKCRFEHGGLAATIRTGQHHELVWIAVWSMKVKFEGFDSPEILDREACQGYGRCGHDRPSLGGGPELQTGRSPIPRSQQPYSLTHELGPLEPCITLPRPLQPQNRLGPYDPTGPVPRKRTAQVRNGHAISPRFQALSGATEPWACRGNAECWLGPVPSPPTEQSSLKAAKQEILEPRMKHGWNTDWNSMKW